MQSNRFKQLFLLKEGITFLNFGSFGSCPRPVFDEYQRFQLEMEQEPVQFITKRSLAYFKVAREALGKFIGCHSDDLVLVSNPSYAVNIVTRSLNLQPGDEVLATDLEYGACDKAWNYICRKTGANYVRQHIQLPLTTKEKVVEDFFKGCTDKTRLVFISHITSATALILPVKEICEEAKRRGLLTFVDGAHAPAHVPLHLAELKADIYTGACHKWMMTPKGCSFLYVKRELQNAMDPLVVSWGYESAAPSHSQFLDYHQMQGTRDMSAFFTIPAAIQFMQANNWSGVSQQCRQLVRDNAPRFFELLGAQPLSPLTEEFVGQMVSIPLVCKEPEELQALLYETYKIEIPVMRLGDKVYLRYSVNAFNSQSDLDTLYRALSAIVAAGKL